jgi:hypothetical protein
MDDWNLIPGRSIILLFITTLKAEEKYGLRSKMKKYGNDVNRRRIYVIFKY